MLLAQRGPLGEGPAGSLIGPGETASHSGGLWPRAFKRWGGAVHKVQCVPDASGRRVHSGLFESLGFGVLLARALKGLYKV